MEITKNQFLALYEADLVSEVFTVEVGTQQRIYGKTSKEQDLGKKIVVYAVI